MIKHKDLLSVLRANKMRITPARRALIQFILDNKTRQVALKEIFEYLGRKVEGVDRSSVYRNLEVLKGLDIIQELTLPKAGKCYQYVFDRKVHHFFICKSCGKSSRGNVELFDRIDKALREVHGFSKANLSVVFYGQCSACSRASNQ
jgi:Fur family ferric uptake transcriptional regulator